MRTLSFVVLLMLTCPLILAAQDDPRAPERGGLTKSLGLPIRYKWHLGASVGTYRVDNEEQIANQLRLGVFKDMGNPLAGLWGLSFEGYYGHRNDLNDGGVRGLAVSPSLRVGAGVDYSFRDGDGDFMLKFAFPIRRGGVFGSGTSLFFEYLPGRDHSVNLAVQLPLGQPQMGKTRPKRNSVKLSAPELEPVPYEIGNPTLTEALGGLRDAAHWINRFTTPFIDQNARGREKAFAKFAEGIQELKAHYAESHSNYRDGRSSEEEIRVYHEELDRAFSIAVESRSYVAGESSYMGRTIALSAREILLEDVILPYNSLLGQKKDKDSTLEFAKLARGAFARWVVTESRVTHARMNAVQYVFQQLLDIVEENRAYSREQWGDSRLVWIPMHYALKPDQYDSQAEMDALIERATGTRFTEGNRVWYVISEQFQWEMAKMIHAAEDYHVLWIHDVRGINEHGEPDKVSYIQVLDSYLAALTEKVEQYDRTGKLPVYIILIDEFYYEVNKGRIWLELLQAPLDHKLELPGDSKEMEGAIASAQDNLRAAVANSKLLQAERRQYGDDWLKNLVKVHVNITNPPDFTFISHEIVPLLGFPDNAMRDHRKISFYDITEEDPYRGMVVYTGTGVGEHYVGRGWEDRAIMAQGPAVLSVKDAARQLLLNQGFKENEIPYPLQKKSKAADYDEIVLSTAPAEGSRARAMEIHSQTGFRFKPIDVTRAIAYSLMPKGSVLIIPDSLWNNPFYASLLFGNALRGARVLIISPSLASAPSAGFPQMSRAQELFARLVGIQDMMADEIASSGGMLKIGLYDPKVGAIDLRGKLDAIQEAFANTGFLRELFGFDPSVYEMLDRMHEVLDERGLLIEAPESEDHAEQTKLHMKTQFYASEEGWTKLLARPEWAGILQEYMIQRAIQVNERDSYTDVRDLPKALMGMAVPMLEAYQEQLTRNELERVILYLMVGSANQNYRSMVMDGEVMFVISGWASMHGLMDFLGILGMTTWVDDSEDLEKLLPEFKEWQRRMGRFVKLGV